MRLIFSVTLLLLLSLVASITSARSLPNCNDKSRTRSSTCSRGSSRNHTLSTAWSQHTAIKKWFGFGPELAWYPTGDCATECSWNPAPLMRHCVANLTQGIPETSCKPVDDAGVCPTMRYLDAVLPENYCMPRFEADCTNPSNIGCSSRCILYIIIKYHCVADAYDLQTGRFNASCVYCNLCWDQSGVGTVAAGKVPYAVMRARSARGSLTKNHWLVLPKAPCIGIESRAPGCTDAQGEYLWSSAYYEALRLGFTYREGTPDWALMVNAPNRRGVHQLHIHIAAFDQERNVSGVAKQDWLGQKVAHHEELSTSAEAPTVFMGEGYYNQIFFNQSSCSHLGRPPRNWARAYAVFVATDDPITDLGSRIRPWELGRSLSTASALPAHGYGLLIMPRKMGNRAGLIIAITWSTDDVEQLDVSEIPGDPIGFRHTCHNYIGVGTSGAVGTL